MPRRKSTIARWFSRLFPAEGVYIARQGLALRGDGYEEDGNFFWLFTMKGDDLTLLEWPKLKRDKYVSSKIQNELLKVMSRHLL